MYAICKTTSFFKFVFINSEIEVVKKEEFVFNVLFNIHLYVNFHALYQVTCLSMNMMKVSRVIYFTKVLSSYSKEMNYL